jgi:GxxExxY protein
MNINSLSEIVIGKAIDVHKSLGPGLLESVYENCLYWELQQAGLKVHKQKPLPVFYKGIKMEVGYRLDLLVDNRLVLEIKSVDFIHDVHVAQVLTYLKLGNYQLGLIINFNVAKLKTGIRRLANGELGA